MQNLIKLKRKLTPRELRRLKIHLLLPADSVDLKIYGYELQRRGIEVYEIEKIKDPKKEAKKSIRSQEFSRKKREREQTIFQRLMQSFQSSKNLKNLEKIEKLSIDSEDQVFEGKFPLSRYTSNPKENLLIPPELPVKVLIICEKTDSTFKGILAGCEKLHFLSVSAKSFESAREIYQSLQEGEYQLVIADTRNKFKESLQFGKVFRKLLGNESSILIGITEKLTLKKEVPMKLSLMDVGYNLCVAENSIPGYWTSEIRTIYQSLVRPQGQVALQTIFYKILGNIDDALMVTDAYMKVQYVNKSLEDLLNQKAEVFLGKALKNIVSSSLWEIQMKLAHLREFEGSLTFDFEDPVTVYFKAFPGSISFRELSHMIFMITSTVQEEESDESHGKIVKKRTISLGSLIYPWEKLKSKESLIRMKSNENSDMDSEMKKLMEDAMQWDFEIFELELCSKRNPLLYLGMELFKRFDVGSVLSCDEATFKNWLMLIESHYRSTNSYHNSTHAADVLQSAGCLVQHLFSKIVRSLSRLDEVSVLLAAACHDIDHPGRCSPFLIQIDDPLAILYNDEAILESHHAALTFKLTLNDPDANIFKNLHRRTYKRIRRKIIDMILGTEMTRHFEHVALFVKACVSPTTKPFISEDEIRGTVRRMLIKVADVSNPCRPLKYCVEWAKRISVEYLEQTDEEKQNNLEIFNQNFDRESCNISRSQVGFIEFVILDLIKTWNEFVEVPEMIRNMKFNYAQWKKYEMQGIKTLRDLRKKQETLGNLTGLHLNLTAETEI